MLMQKEGFNNEDIRRSNDCLILCLLFEHGALTKAELTHMTGLTARSIQLIAERLLKARLIKLLPTQKGKVGQPSTPLALSASGAYGIGIKIGRRRLTVQKSNLHFDLTHRLDVSYPAMSCRKIVSATKKLVKQIKAQKSRGKFSGMAVCLPQNNLSPQEHIVPQDLVNRLQDALGENLLCLSDIEAASLGEIWVSKSRLSKAPLSKLHWQSYYYFFIGTYVTGSMVMNGEIYHGAFAGDFSHYPILQRGKKVRVKKLHECASLIHLDQCLTDNGEEGVLVNGLSGAEVKSPDEFSPLGQQIIDEWLENAAYSVSQVITQLQPILALQGVVIETALLPELRHQLCDKVQRYLPQMPCRHGSIGASARSYGAAIAPLLSYFKPQLLERGLHA